MNFSDIFKTSFLQEHLVNLTTVSIAAYMVCAAIIGFYVYTIYRFITKKSFYNKNFNISLWVLTVITAAIIITISSNIILSLGMVGALSIVRYRTAIKDPMDLVFLFWAIAEGIMCGAGMAAVGLILALVITVGILVLNKLPLARETKILTISASDYQCELTVMDIVKRCCKRYKVRSRVFSAGQLDLVIEFESADEAACMAALMEVRGVHSVATLTYDGEATV